MVKQDKLIELEVIDHGVYVDVGIDKDNVVYLIRK